MYSHYVVVFLFQSVQSTTTPASSMMNINSPEVQDLIHDVVYGIGPIALECDDFQSLPVDLRMSLLAEVEDLIHLEYGEAEFLETHIDQLDPIGVSL
jgi:hypothetical protein